MSEIYYLSTNNIPHFNYLTGNMSLFLYWVQVEICLKFNSNIVSQFLEYMNNKNLKTQSYNHILLSNITYVEFYSMKSEKWEI